MEKNKTAWYILLGGCESVDKKAKAIYEIPIQYIIISIFKTPSFPPSPPSPLSLPLLSRVYRSLCMFPFYTAGLVRSVGSVTRRISSIFQLLFWLVSPPLTTTASSTTKITPTTTTPILIRNFHDSLIRPPLRSIRFTSVRHTRIRRSRHLDLSLLHNCSPPYPFPSATLRPPSRNPPVVIL